MGGGEGPVIGRLHRRNTHSGQHEITDLSPLIARRDEFTLSDFIF